MNSPAATDTQPADTPPYRLKRSYLLIGTGCTAFFVPMGLFCAVAVWGNVQGNAPMPKTAIGFVTVTWSAFTMLGVYLIAAYYRERLFVSRAAIRRVGCFRTRTLALDHVDRVVWRTRPVGGSVVLRSALQKMTIAFGNYTQPERQELATFLRDRLANDLHDGWLPFVEHFLEPSRQRQQAAFRLQGLAILLGVAFAVTFLGAWAAGLGAQYLLLAALNLIVALRHGIGWRRRTRSGR